MAALREVVEASTAASESVLRERSVKSLQAEAERLAARDPGVGDQDMRRQVQQTLRGDVAADRVGWHKLHDIIPQIERGYLQRWASAAQQTGHTDQERAARYIAGHLLGAGFSETYLHRWLRYRVRHDPDDVTLSQILEEADADLGRRASRQFEVVIPCTSVPRIRLESPPAEWRSASDMSCLLSRLSGDTARVRHNGGFVIGVTAQDPFGAVEQAREFFDRWAARVALGNSGKLVATGHAWVAGVEGQVALAPERRQIHVGALAREHLLYATLDDSEIAIRLDDALQLAQPLTDGPRAAAIGGGWAALESLLTAPGEGRAVAASRLAAIVACSFPRAELTMLSYLHQQYGSDALAQTLSKETENLRRAHLMADAIRAGQSVVGRGARDDAAYDRMVQVLQHPRETLRRVRRHLEGALDRLYRQRNLILHGGRVSGEGRKAALRTAPPIVGAGLDRLAHGWFAEETSPVELVARAELNLGLVTASGTPNVVELLERMPEPA